MFVILMGTLQEQKLSLNVITSSLGWREGLEIAKEKVRENRLQNISI